MTRKRYLILISLLVFIGVAAFILIPEVTASNQFDGERALADVATQLSFGDRSPGTTGHARTVAWIKDTLKQAGWEFSTVGAPHMGADITNIVATRNFTQNKPTLWIGAHFDSRRYADNDPDPSKRSLPVPGANDGASGVAVLLELARTLPKELPVNLQLIFIDAEDQGRIADWDWIIGSRQLASLSTDLPDQVIIIDMIGDADQTIYYEANSHRAISEAIWAISDEKGYAEFFIPEVRHSMLDDHTPFVELGIPAIDIIDFDYAHWHTTSDTADKVSAASLQRIGAILTEYVVNFDKYQKE